MKSFPGYDSRLILFAPGRRIDWFQGFRQVTVSFKINIVGLEQDGHVLNESVGKVSLQALCGDKVGNSRHHHYLLWHSGTTILASTNGTQSRDRTLPVGSVVIDQTWIEHVLQPVQRAFAAPITSSAAADSAGLIL